MSTYRSELQNIIKELQATYDKVGYLRDHSDRDGQVVFNKVRSQLPPVWDMLNELDNSLDNAIANQDV